MSLAMPERVKNNFIYKLCWTNVHRKKKDTVLIFIGDRGHGKSIGALRFGQDLDPNFTAKRVVHSAKELMRLFNSGLPRGSVVVFDEVAGSDEGIHSRRAMSKTNLILSWVTQTIRFKNYIIILTCPSYNLVDSNVRELVTGIMEFKGIDFERNLALATFKRRISFPSSGKIIMPYERIVDHEGRVVIPNKIWVTKPRQDLIDEYEKGRKEFMKNKYKYYERLLNKMEVDRNIKAKPTFKAWFDEAKIRVHDFLDYTQKKVVSGKLLIEFESQGMKQREAMRLARVLNDNIKSGALKV